MDLAAAHHASVSWWWVVPILLISVLGIGYRFALARRMAKGNRAAGRPWWKGNGGVELTTPMRAAPGYFWVGFGVATAALLFLILFETVGHYHPRFNPLFFLVPIYILLVVQAARVVRRRR